MTSAHSELRAQIVRALLNRAQSGLDSLAAGLRKRGFSEKAIVAESSDYAKFALERARRFANAAIKDFSADDIKAALMEIAHGEAG